MLERIKIRELIDTIEDVRDQLLEEQSRRYTYFSPKIASHSTC